MIAKFPKFSKLDIKHQKDVEAITSSFEPYSDFNFISLFSWNTDGSTEVSDLNSNLVIHLPDYLTGRPVLSLLGGKQIDESLNKLLSSAKELKLVPEVVIENISHKNGFNFFEDEDNHDYTYLVEEHAHLPGEKFSEKRKKYNRFVRNFSGRFDVCAADINDVSARETVMSIFDEWSKVKNKADKDIKQEKQALKILLDNSHYFDLTLLLMHVDNKPTGFSIHEPRGDYAITHFHKTLTNYDNIDVFLTSQAAQDLLRRGCLYVNWEQDLGINSLRKAKQSYKPVKMLKKFIIRKKG